MVIRRPRIGYPSGGTMSGGVVRAIAEKIYASHMSFDVQMITGQVRENPPVERQAADAPLIDRMRANLHKSILTSGLYHPGHQGMKRKRVRCRMIRRYRLAIYIITYRGKQSHLMSHLPEHLI